MSYQNSRLFKSNSSYNSPNRLTTAPSVSNGSQNFQINQIENKINNYEQGYLRQNTNLNDLVKQLIKTEANLKLELSTKIRQNVEIQKDLTSKETKISQLNQYIQNLESRLDHLAGDYSNLNNSYNKLKIYLQSIETEKENYEKVIIQLKGDSNFQKETIDEQNMMLKKFEGNTEIIGSMKNEMEIINNKLSVLRKQNETLSYDNASLKEEIAKQIQLNSTLSSEINQIQSDCFSLTQVKNNLETENRKLVDDLNNLQKSIAQSNNEKSRVEDISKSYLKKTQDSEKEVIQLKNDLIKIVSTVNDDIAQLARWMENYLPTVFSPNVQLPEIQILSKDLDTQIISKDFHGINFELMKKKLIVIKNQIDSDITSLQNENKNLRYGLTTQQEENFKVTKFLENIYNNIKYEVETNKYFKISNYAVELNYPSALEDIITKSMNLLRQLKAAAENEAEAEAMKVENSNLKKDLYNLEQALLAKNQQCYDLESVQEENLTLRSQVGLFEKMQKENKKLLSELELKNSLINEQKEIDDKINQLEIDKNILIKDNVALLRENDKLKKELYYYQQQEQGEK